MATDKPSVSGGYGADPECGVRGFPADLPGSAAIAHPSQNLPDARAGRFTNLAGL